MEESLGRVKKEENLGRVKKEESLGRVKKPESPIPGFENCFVVAKSRPPHRPYIHTYCLKGLVVLVCGERVPSSPQGAGDLHTPPQQSLTSQHV
ncbi:hypothetical protein Pcinc_039807 [Petrolisthes cinctipes]|uniref:Uncharacterized protein n=1 Tax=Petrolisthes cinctipes TaxID=88211 RepID=A0AAE1EJ58_PETCI|nr:hypothetical protein Pcinc_039807 [Petrolisthes cinctipes]